jgi:hypothetical protein
MAFSVNTGILRISTHDLQSPPTRVNVQKTAVKILFVRYLKNYQNSAGWEPALCTYHVILSEAKNLRISISYHDEILRPAFGEAQNNTFSIHPEGRGNKL